MKSKGTELKPATVKIIGSIESKEVRELLLHGYDPQETVEGFWYSLALAIWKLQEGRA